MSAVPRLLIAGTHSGVGKTTISTGIMAALAARGMTVQGFKVGPDYIDPSYHTGATGRVSRNLDVWLLRDQLVPSFERAAAGADLAVVEGVMGLYDGIKGQKSTGSSAHVASLIGAPVLLIVDVRSTAYSAAALVHGFASFDPKVKLGGVILNRVGSESHLEMVRDAIESLGIPVLGHLGKEEQLTLPERHLGLVPLAERGKEQKEYFNQLAQVIEAGVDLERVVEMAKNWGPCSTPEIHPNRLEQEQEPPVKRERVRIAVARDEAFSFYYQDALDVLESFGAEIVDFSPLHDQKLPAGTGGIFIGGGFPESFLDQLSSNRPLHLSLKQAHDQGVPIYAECGGLMYLCREITGFAGERFAGAGLVPGSCVMTKRLQGMGYRKGVFLQDNILGAKGESVQGHEFHYSSLKYDREGWAYSLSTANGEVKGFDGYIAKNILGSYLHLNFAGNPGLASNFLAACYKNQEGATWASR